MSDFDTYIIPNRNTITLGGCRHYGNYDLTVSESVKADIQQRCTALLPSLKDAEFVRDWVGLRPHRDPVRVETETIALPSGKQLPVIPFLIFSQFFKRKNMVFLSSDYTW